MKILLSIKPKYVSSIMNGTKKFEFRRKIFKRKDVDTVVVYATKPIGKVVGEFEIKQVISDTPKSIWNMTAQYAGLDKLDFYNYFEGLDEAFAIQISKVTPYKKQLDLSELEDGNLKAPQSFIY
ncbi:ASCH domain-containing protein, partial [Lactobacillus crispatus]